MYVIKAANGNIYPVEQCVYRIAEIATGYKLTHLDLINVSGTPAPALQASLTAATAGDLLGYIGKSGRFVAITEPAT